MLKPASSNCNLACEYCFYHSLSSKRTDFSKGFMSDDTAKRVVDSALEFADSTDVYFTFQGGEPLLCSLDFYKNFVSYVKKSNKKGSNVHYCLQTNATLINDEFALFFKENGFLIGVSLDGDKEVNKYRIYPNGKSSFDDILKGIDMNNDDYAYFLTKGFNIYYNDYLRGDFVSIRTFDNYISLINGNNAEQCGMNGFCSNQFVVEGDGSVYPCDFYCTDEWLLGNINESSFKQMYKTSKCVEFIKSSFKLDDKCKECKYFYICRGGGCRRNRESSDYCLAYRQFFSQCEDKLKTLKKVGVN